ncbi:MAG: hypothetical protein JXR37_26185 [Kiritimatiellae bacterium]|nr:hypothetical protein [Kiritimatiellia bacterium]
MDVRPRPDRYSRLLMGAADLLAERLQDLPQPSRLMCWEKRVIGRHRKPLAQHLETMGWTVEHIE